MPWLKRLRANASLRLRLLLLMGALLFSLLLVSAVAVLAFISVTDRATWRARQQEVAQSAAERVSAFVLQTMNSLNAVTLLDRAYLLDNPAALQPFLTQNPALLEITRLSPEGAVVATAALETPQFVERLAVDQANWFLAAQEGERYFGQVELDKDFEPYLIIAVPTPLKGAVVARLKMDLLWEVVEQIHFGESGKAYVVDRNGRIISHQTHEFVVSHQTLDPTEPLLQAITAMREMPDQPYVNFLGERVLGVTKEIPGTPWVVVTELNAAEVFTRFRLLAVLFASGLLLLLVLALRVISYLLDAHVLSPLQALQAAAEHVGQGDFAHPLPLLRPDEIGAVTGAFNAMAHQLNVREQTLAAQAETLAAEVEEHRRTAQALRSSEATNRAIIEALPDLLLRVQRDGTVLGVRSGRDWQAWALPTDLVGRHLYAMLPSPLVETVKATIAEGLASRALQTLEFDLPANGAVHNFEARIAASGEHELLGVVRDITERKQRETLLQRALENERKMGELKSRFMTLMSHEFRTPLAIILTTAELLERAAATMPAERRTHYFDSLRTQVHHLTHILDDILMISRVETVGIEINRQPVDAAEFCLTTLEELGPLLNEHEVIFREHNGHQRVEFDTKLMRQALTNLLSNASKYSAPGRPIQVTLTIHDQCLRIEVQDAGIGIAPEDQRHLFTAFHRGRNADYRPGIGLGLTIVKHAVELHGGSVTCESQLDVGTTFTITMPLVASSDAPPRI
jgi:signal transduction histidine kinase/HAMP domain-containing protein